MQNQKIPPMKLINIILFSLAVLMFTSCIMDSDTDKTDIAPLVRADMIGCWRTTIESIREVLKEKPANEIITSFRTYSDSTVVIYYQVAMNQEIVEGTWKWEGAKKSGNGILSDNTSNSIVIMSPGFDLAMMPVNTNGKLTLTANNYLFEKQPR